MLYILSLLLRNALFPVSLHTSSHLHHALVPNLLFNEINVGLRAYYAGEVVCARASCCVRTCTLENNSIACARAIIIIIMDLITSAPRSNAENEATLCVVNMSFMCYET